MAKHMGTLNMPWYTLMCTTCLIIFTFLKSSHQSSAGRKTGLHVRDKNFSFKFMNHINMTWFPRSLELLVHQHTPISYTNRGHRGFLLKKCNFCISASSKAKSNRSGGFRAGKYCTTQTLWEPGRRQCSGNKRTSSHNSATLPHTCFFILRLLKGQLLASVCACVQPPCKYYSQTARWFKCDKSSVTVRKETILKTHSSAWYRCWDSWKRMWRKAIMTEIPLWFQS